MNETTEYWKFYELLKQTNLEIGYWLISNERIVDEALIEFSEIQASFLFIMNHYLESLKVCGNALYRDESNLFCNFLKASIVEICNINKMTPKYKIALLNYQAELINKCNLSEIGNDKLFLTLILTEILEVSKNITGKRKNIQFTKVSDNFKGTDEIIWNKEKNFYLNNRLFLNPLNNFEKFVEASIEELEDLNIDKNLGKMFYEIVEDYKFCRYKVYCYRNEKNVTKREMSMAYSYIYSIFDKIAFLIKRVLDLNISDDCVGFTKQGLFNVKLNKSDIKFSSLQNNNILPLYLIMKQVRGKQDLSDALKVGTFEHNELRNTIEHKSLILVDDNKLKRNSLEILQKARDAILYTFMLLYSIDKKYSNDSISAINTTYLKIVNQLK